MQLAVTNHGGEGLLLDGGRAQLNAVQDGGVQDVETSVDAVADELDRLLDETINAGRVVGLVHNDTVVGGLLDLGDNNSALVAVGLVEFGQLLERVFAGDIGVEDEERAIILAQDLSSELEGTGGAQGLRLDGERDLDAKLFLVLVPTHKSAHNPEAAIMRIDCNRQVRGIVLGQGTEGIERTSFRCASMISGR